MTFLATDTVLVSGIVLEVIDVAVQDVDAQRKPGNRKSQHEDITKDEEYVRFFVLHPLLKRSKRFCIQRRLGVFGNGRRRAAPFHFSQLARPTRPTRPGAAHTHALASLCSRPASSEHMFKASGRTTLAG